MDFVLNSIILICMKLQGNCCERIFTARELVIVYCNITISCYEKRIFCCGKTILYFENQLSLCERTSCSVKSLDHWMSTDLCMVIRFHKLSHPLLYKNEHCIAYNHRSLYPRTEWQVTTRMQDVKACIVVVSFQNTPPQHELDFETATVHNSYRYLSTGFTLLWKKMQLVRVIVIIFNIYLVQSCDYVVVVVSARLV